MAYFARINDAGTVEEILAVPDSEQVRGNEYLASDLGLGGTWVQTSYNSRGGKRFDPDTGAYASDEHYRYNFAAIGGYFDPEFGPDGAFIPPQPRATWTLDQDTATWVAPLPTVPMPSDGSMYSWDEESLSWIKLTPEQEAALIAAGWAPPA